MPRGGDYAGHVADDAQLLDRAAAAVASAMVVARDIQRGLLDGMSVRKDDGSPVTVADFAVQAIVALALRDAVGPGLQLIGEESSGMLAGHALAEVRDAIVAAVHHVHPEIGADDVLSAIDLGASAGSDDFWTIDPVDGTKGFLRAGQYAIALARIVRGEAVMAVLGCPNLAPDASRPFDDPTEEGTLLLAMRGAGCWQRAAREPSGEDVRVRRAPIDPLGVVRLCDSVDASVSVLGTGFDGAPPEAGAATGAWSSVGSATGTATARGPRRVAPDASSPGTSPATAPTPGRTTAKRRRILAPFMGRMTVVQLDSQVKYAMLARGQGDIYLRPPRPAIPVEHIWDHAAGSLVASEAGATVTDLRGRALDFGRGRDLSDNCGVLACAPELHAAILRAAASVDLDPFAAG